MTDYEVVIGLEVHSQLLTKSKMFCSCAAGYQDGEPNTIVCEVCMGMPGVLPVINRRAVELVMATGLALGSTISEQTRFDRKNYPYPDLMKGYQISQYEQPIAVGGHLEIESNGAAKTIGVTRVHLEEDTAKLLHRDGQNGNGYSLLDINRAGVPLMEIVSEPDMRSADEARSYLTSLHSILRYIDVSTANMEEGSFRCDANISIRPRGAEELGAKVEVKNMNSFRAVHRALEFEAERQTRLAGEGERIVQETRGWAEDRAVTVSQRTKEYASDYRYFPEPDLPPLAIDRAWVEDVRSRLPELPEARKARYVEEYGLPAYDAGLLTASKSTAEFFEAALRVRPLEGEEGRRVAKLVSNWTTGELARLLKATGVEMDAIKVQPAHMIEMLDLIDSGALSTGMARGVFAEMFTSGAPPGQIVDKGGMAQISDAGSIRPAVEEAVASNPDPVNDYLGGKETAMKYLVGQVMKITRGQANPKLASEIMKDKLESMR